MDRKISWSVLDCEMFSIEFKNLEKRHLEICLFYNVENSSISKSLGTSVELIMKLADNLI